MGNGGGVSPPWGRRETYLRLGGAYLSRCRMGREDGAAGQVYIPAGGRGILQKTGDTGVFGVFLGSILDIRLR